MENQVAISACKERRQESRQYDPRKGKLSGVVRDSFLDVLESLTWPEDLTPAFLYVIFDINTRIYIYVT